MEEQRQTVIYYRDKASCYGGGAAGLERCLYFDICEHFGLSIGTLACDLQLIEHIAEPGNETQNEIGYRTLYARTKEGQLPTRDGGEK
jgi:hypothetical protein